jgi:DNA invertase Pin-like site-specific DNA recombinase
VPIAYSYIRFSTRAQADCDSLRRQTEKARAYARKHSLPLDDQLTFQDLGVSAYDRSNATSGQLGAFMEALETGKVARGSFLLVEQFDRLSRAKPILAFRQLEQLISAGIQVVTLDDEKVYNNDSADISMLFLSMATMFRAHNESVSKSKRIGDAWKAKVTRREPVLTRECPWWLTARADRSGFDVIEQRAKSVRRVFDLTIKGYGNVDGCHT